MIYTLKNDKLEIAVNSLGAELQSMRRLQDGTEYLWQGDATYWANRATNIFPHCGRMIDGKYTYAGQTYEMPIHGFVKLQEWSVVHQAPDALTLKVEDNDETRALYPFRFSMEMAYTLVDETLTVALQVKNLDDKTLIFSVGGHPGFNLPLNKGEAFEDYYVEFDEPCRPRRLCFSETCFYLNDSKPFDLEDGKRLWMRHDLFEQDAIFLRDMSKGVTLRSRTGERYVRMAYPDMKFLGFWHKPFSDAPYVCIEPWSGVPALDGAINALEDKLEAEHLQPQGVYRNVYTITLG